MMPDPYYANRAIYNALLVKIVQITVRPVILLLTIDGYLPLIAACALSTTTILVLSNANNAYRHAKIVLYWRITVHPAQICVSYPRKMNVYAF